MLIISLFSFIVLSLTRHSYNKYKLVQTTIGVSGNLSCLVIILIVMLIVIAMLTPPTMP
jgi:hypothetical protein